MRTKSDKSPLQVLRATEVYYDVERERAIALAGGLEFTPRFAPDPFHLRGREIWRLDAENWEVHDASFDSSKLPSDPGLRIDSDRVTYNERQVRLRNVFGLPYRDLLTGEPIFGDERTVTAYGAVPKVMGVPVWYWPRVRTDANDPLGPFVGMGFGQNRVFGTQVYSTWDIFDLLALRPPPGHRWRLNVDYLSKRGAALGTDYLYKLPGSTPGMWGSEGMIKLYGIHDEGVDILGGNRGPEPIPPDFRGRAGWRHQQEILEGTYFQGQVVYLSDQNFLEQYYKNEFDLGAEPGDVRVPLVEPRQLVGVGPRRACGSNGRGSPRRSGCRASTARSSASRSSTCSCTPRGPTRAMPSPATRKSTRPRSSRPTRTSTPAASISFRN